MRAATPAELGDELGKNATRYRVLNLVAVTLGDAGTRHRWQARATGGDGQAGATAALATPTLRWRRRQRRARPALPRRAGTRAGWAAGGADLSGQAIWVTRCLPEEVAGGSGCAARARVPAVRTSGAAAERRACGRTERYDLERW